MNGCGHKKLPLLNSKLSGKFGCAILILLHQLFIYTYHDVYHRPHCGAHLRTIEKQTPVAWKIDEWKSSIVGYTGPWIPAQNGDFFSSVSKIKTDMQQRGNIGFSSITWHRSFGFPPTLLSYRVRRFFIN